MEGQGTTLRIGTRGSKLALWQSEWVKRRLEKACPGLKVDLVRIRTTGDKILDAPLSNIGGKGLFVKEIEEALFSRKIDLAVHSLKDVPVDLPPGLALCCYTEREEVRDALISRNGWTLHELPEGAKVGTSSLRRAAQILHLRPGLKVVPLRGNVDTRLRKLDQGEFDAIILAGAGLKRLGLSHRVTHYLEPTEILPAIGQGSLGIEVRGDDAKTIDMLSPLNHKLTEMAVRAERAFLRRLEGGCQVPIAAHASFHEGGLTLAGMVAELDGRNVVRGEVLGSGEEAEELGVRLAEELLARGADNILRNIYGK